MPDILALMATRHANQVLARADLVIALGSRIDSRQTANVQEFMKGKMIVHVEIDPQVIGSTVETELCINMHLKTFLEAVLERLETDSVTWPSRDGWLGRIAEVKNLLLQGDIFIYEGELNPSSFWKNFLRPSRMGPIYTVDVGSHQNVVGTTLCDQNE